jgi:DNA-binding transcriptional LysR family regulator
MNLHHLELFYYVAKHGGISEAVRNIPYGIQQPAVSSQIAQLEEFIGATLFQRRPFALSLKGQELYDFIRPFFGNLPALSDRICGGSSHQLRVGASATVLRDHMPEMLRHVRSEFPGLSLTLREGYQPTLESLLQKQEIDVALTFLGGKPPPGIHAMPLLKLSLTLLVNANSRLASADELWGRDRIEESLIAFPANEAITKCFQQGLSRLGIDWFTRIEVSSLDLIATYVANAFGIGLYVAVPRSNLPPQVRMLPLKGFPTLTFGGLWRGKISPPVKALLNEAQARALWLMRE